MEQEKETPDKLLKKPSPEKPNLKQPLQLQKAYDHGPATVLDGLFRRMILSLQEAETSSPDVTLAWKAVRLALICPVNKEYVRWCSHHKISFFAQKQIKRFGELILGSIEVDFWKQALHAL